MKIDYRSVVCAPKGKLLVSIDLSQAESWVVAYLADERNMKFALKESDIHCQGAGAIFVLNGCYHHWIKGENRCSKCGETVTKDQRYIGKRNNHASSYGMGPEKKMKVINADSDKPPYISITLQEAKEQHQRWHSFYQVTGWWEEVRWKLKNNDRTITNSYGRSRRFYGPWGDELEREAIAYEPQSTVADHFNGKVHPEYNIKGGLIEIYNELIEPFFCGDIWCNHVECHKIINQSHDSCIMELPSAVAEEVGMAAMQLLYRPLVIKNEEFYIPVDGEIGERWSSEMEAINFKPRRVA